MYIFIIGAFAAMVSVAALNLVHGERVENPLALRGARAQLDLYRSFAYAATQYVTVNPYPGGGVQTITWTTLAAAASTPGSMRLLAMPTSWVVKRDLARWVICAEMDEAAVGQALASLPVGKKFGVPRTAIGTYNAITQHHYIIGEPDNDEAIAYSDLCAS